MTAEVTKCERARNGAGRMRGEGMATGRCTGYQLHDIIVCKAVLVPAAQI